VAVGSTTHVSVSYLDVTADRLVLAPTNFFTTPLGNRDIWDNPFVTSESA